MHVEELLTYMRFLNDFSAIKRTVKLSGRGELESDSEHSFQLALTAWYVAEKLEMGLRRELILTYALVHDLVEVYSGDTDPYNSPTQFVASQHDQEKEALERIRREFPDFVSLHTAIDGYESFADEESKLVYALDKVLPAMNTLLANDDYYSRSGVTYERWRKHNETKHGKVNLQNEKLKSFFEQVFDYFQTVNKNFFKNE
jgi:putative hydrolase of HD superfamily